MGNGWYGPFWYSLEGMRWGVRFFLGRGEGEGCEDSIGSWERSFGVCCASKRGEQVD